MRFLCKAKGICKESVQIGANYNTRRAGRNQNNYSSDYISHRKDKRYRLGPVVSQVRFSTLAEIRQGANF